MIESTHESEHYRRALEAEPVLQVIEQVVGWICERGLPCNKFWSTMVKPLTLPHLGVLRGYGVENANNVSRADRAHVEILTDLMADLERLDGQTKTTGGTDRYRLPAGNDTEEWLRTSEAWDAVTQVWIRRM